MNKILIGKANGFASMFPNGPIDKRIYRIEAFQHIVKEIEYLRRSIAIKLIGEHEVCKREKFIRNQYSKKTDTCLKVHDTIKIFDIVQINDELNGFELL